MRAVFLLLVLANVGFFAWARYYTPSGESVPLARQVDPDKLKIVPPRDMPPLSLSQKMAGPAVTGCLEWGSFSLAEAPRAEKALEPLGLGSRLGQRRTEEAAGWWVYIPPQASRQAALKKAAELKSLAVDDYFIVQEEGEFHWALSLGVFRTEEAAQARLTTLRDQGVRSAQVGPRETIVPKLWLQVKGVDAALASRLRDIARQIEGTELRSCP
jgi:hypothetical protein